MNRQPFDILQRPVETIGLSAGLEARLYGRPEARRYLDLTA